MEMTHEMLFRDPTRPSELARIGMELAARSTPFVHRNKPDALMRAAYARELRGMANPNESPWVTYRRLIRAGKVRLVERRNKPPLLQVVKPKRRYP